jgi:mono/diheme cytochrome c family protein
MKYCTFIVLLGFATAASPARAAEAELPKLPPVSTQSGVTYAKDIKPLFEASCFQCHGAQRPKGNLRLDSLEGVLKGSEEGKVITPGDSTKSKLVISVAQVNPKTAMPPKPRNDRRGPGSAPAAGTNAPAGNRPAGPQGPPPKPLTAEQVGLVRAWIDQGAK